MADANYFLNYSASWPMHKKIKGDILDRQSLSTCQLLTLTGDRPSCHFSRPRPQIFLDLQLLTLIGDRSSCHFFSRPRFFSTSYPILNLYHTCRARRAGALLPRWARVFETSTPFGFSRPARPGCQAVEWIHPTIHFFDCD